MITHSFTRLGFVELYRIETLDSLTAAWAKIWFGCKNEIPYNHFRPYILPSLTKRKLIWLTQSGDWRWSGVASLRMIMGVNYWSLREMTSMGHPFNQRERTWLFTCISDCVLLWNYTHSPFGTWLCYFKSVSSNISYFTKYIYYL